MIRRWFEALIKLSLHRKVMMKEGHLENEWKNIWKIIFYKNILWSIIIQCKIKRRAIAARRQVHNKNFNLKSAITSGMRECTGSEIFHSGRGLPKRLCSAL